MASIKFGGGVSEIRGSIGGTVFSRNKNGAYTRQRTKNVNRNTAKQQAVRAQFSYISQLWRSNEFKQSWQQGTANYPYTNRLGEQATYTAKQLFQKINSQLASVGVAPIGTCPVPTIVPPITFANAVYDVSSTTLIVTWDVEGSLAIPSDCVFAIDTTRPISEGVTALKDSDFTRIDTAAAGSEAFTQVDSLIEIIGRPLTTNDIIWLRGFLVNLNTGQRSNPTTYQLSIEA